MIRILSTHQQFTAKCLYDCFVAISVCRPDTLPEVLQQSQSADKVPCLKFCSNLSLQTRYPVWSFVAFSVCRPDILPNVCSNLSLQTDTLPEVLQQSNSVCRPDTLPEVFQQSQSAEKVPCLKFCSNLSLQTRYPV